MITCTEVLLFACPNRSDQRGDTAILLPMGLLSGRLTELSRSPDELRERNLAAWASSIEGAMPIADVEVRCGCKVAGVVQNIRIDPREGTGSIEATIIDGSGHLVAKWLGRSSLQGIRLGVGLIIQGIAGISRDEFVVLNPEYALVPGPEHG
jgi:hypothetical protein